MARPPGNAPEKLLAAARLMARERGCGAITIRELARRTGVNLGLFYYHFKSRDAFVKQVLENVYKDFFSRLSLSAEGPGEPIERLRAALKAIAVFSKEHRRLFVGLLRDAMNGDKMVTEFAASHFPRHIPIILDLVGRCQKKGQLRPLPDALVLGFLMGTLSTPNVIATLVEDYGARRPLGRSVKQFERELLSDAAIDTRIQLILEALGKPR